VGAAWGPVELTSHTPLHSHRDPINLYISVERSPEVIIPVLVWAGSGNHTWIHEGGHGEIDEDEKGYDTLEDGNSIPVLLHDVPFYTRKVEE